MFSSPAYNRLTRLVLLLGCVLLLAAACSTPPPDPDANQSIRWDRRPEAIVFRAEISNGDTTSIGTRDNIADCTLYGDNRVVWTNPIDSQAFEVLYDVIPDERVRGFVETLVNGGIYNYAEESANVIPSATPLLLQRVVLAVNGVEHRADNLSGWSPDWYPGVIATCRTLSNTPILIEPEALWVSAERMAEPPSSALITWDAVASGVDLAALADGQPQWVAGQSARALWRVYTTLPESVAYQQADGAGVLQNYRVAVQVPGISTVSPAAPAEAGTPAAATPPA